MINQVNSTSTNKEVFSPLQSSDVKYALPKPINEKQKEGVKQEKENTSNALGFSIAAMALIVGFGFLAISKGVSKTTRTKLSKAFTKLDSKTLEMSQNGNMSDFDKFYYAAIKNTKAFLARSKALFNTAPLKDVVVNRALKKYPFTKKIGDSITALFEKVSLQTAHRSYRNTSANFDNLYVTFAEANKKIPQAQADIINNRILNIKETYEQGFSLQARNQRLERAKNGLKGIDDKVWDRTYGDLKTFVKDKSTYKSFISEELAAPTKMQFNNELNSYRRKITYGKIDNYRLTKKLLGNIYDFIDPTDANARVILKDISANLKEYKKVIDVKENSQRMVISRAISEDLKKLNSHISSSAKYDKETKCQVSEYIMNSHKALIKNDKGDLQEILTIYRQKLPASEYLKIKEAVNNVSRSLDKSIDTEGDKLFDKVRDLMIGAAPTDVVGVLSSVGVVGWGLSRSDNADQRVSVALKYGIPAIGGVLASLYCTLGLVAGGPALAVGFLSGLVMNKLGVIVDNQVKKYKESREVKA